MLRLLTLKEAGQKGRQGGFISYRNLGINQLGAVYEGLMSYTGIIDESRELAEVAKPGAKKGSNQHGDPEKGSWLVPADRLNDYPENTHVVYSAQDTEQHGLRGPKKYAPGRFIYRLAGRDRETSASYYTPSPSPRSPSSWRSSTASTRRRTPTGTRYGPARVNSCATPSANRPSAPARSSTRRSTWSPTSTSSAARRSLAPTWTRQRRLRRSSG
ncbi:hypothetical protein NKH18_06900 [Streptomyces sp. M10(2022)]